MSTHYHQPDDAPSQRPPLDWHWRALVVMVLLGAALRLYRLDAFGFWRDEAEAVFTAVAAFPGGILATLRGDVHAPLYFLLLHPWEAWLGRGEGAIRLFSALCGIAAIPLTYLAGLRLWNRRVALLAGWIAAILPLHVICSRTARMYSLLPLMALLAMLALHRALDKGGRVSWIAYTLLSAATLYTHYWGALWVCALALTGFLHLALERAEKQRWLAWLASHLGIALLFAPWLPTLLGQLRIQESVAGPWLPRQSVMANILRLFNELTALAWPRGLPFLWMALLALGTFVLSARLSGGRLSGGEERTPTLEVAYPVSLGRNLTVLGLLVPMGLGAFIMARSRGLTPSYVTMAVFPALCLLLGAAFAALKYRPVILLALAGVSFLWLRTDLTFYQRPVSIMREVAQRVTEEAQPGDVVIVAPDYLAPAFSYYFDGPQAQAAFPGLYRRVEGMDWVGWAERRAAAAASIPDMLAYAEENRGETGRILLVAPMEAYPGDPFFESMRELKEGLDRAHVLDRAILDYRGFVETADIFIYRAP